MPTENHEPADPRAEFAAEVAGEAAGHKQESGAPSKDDLEALVARFTSFEPGAPADEGYERILIAKGPAWVPTSGRSTKVGNLRFNLGTLLEAVASGAASVATALKVPIVALLTGLVAFRKLGKAMQVELSEREALVVWSAWSCEQRTLPATAEEVHQLALQEADRVGSTLRPSLQDVQASLGRLEKIGAVRRSDDGTWRTVETVVVRT